MSVSALKHLSKNWGFTHADDKYCQLGMITLYAVSKCKVCGCEIQDPNAIQVGATIANAASAGLLIKPMPDEGGYSDKHEGETCSSCT